MAEQAEIQIPGTKSKLPGKWLLLGGAALVGFLILSKGGGGGGSEEGDGLLAEEVNARLGEQWDAMNQALDDMRNASTEAGDPLASPSEPVEPAPISTPSSEGSTTPWRRPRRGSTAGINIRGSAPLGSPANVSERDPGSSTFSGNQVNIPRETAEQRKARLLEHERRSSFLKGKPIQPKKPVARPETEEARFVTRRTAEEQLAAKTKIPKSKPKSPVIKKKTTPRLPKRR